MGNQASKNEADDDKGSFHEGDAKADRGKRSSDDHARSQPASSDIQHRNVARAYAGASNPFQAALSTFANNAQLACIRARDAVCTAFEKVKEVGSNIGKRIREWAEKHPVETTAIAVSLAAVVLTPAILALIGFTPAGIAAGSAAAAIHSGIGNVAAVSAFAICQSAMMGGYGVFIFAALPALSTATIYACGMARQWWNGGAAPGSVGAPGGGGGGGSSGGDDEGTEQGSATVTEDTSLVRLESVPTITLQEIATDVVQAVQLGAVYVAANAVYRYRRWRQS